MRKVLALALALGLSAQVASAEYVVGAGDVLQITVWQNPTLDRTVTVREDGMLTFPPLGDLRASGLTWDARLSRFRNISECGFLGASLRPCFSIS